MTAPLNHKWNIATRTCVSCGQTAGKCSAICPGAPFNPIPGTQDITPGGIVVASVPVIITGHPLNPTPGMPKALPPIEVSPDFKPLIPDIAAAVEAMPATMEALLASGGPTPAEEVRAAIESDAADAAETAQAVTKVDLQFPAIGFIDPHTELEKMRQLVAAMPEYLRAGYPESIRAKLLAHHADATANPAVTDEELALAIFIRRTTDSALTVEELEAKTAGKKIKAGTAAAKKTTKKKPDIDDILGGLI